jgi:SAM-dependent methyltransferase
MQDERQKGREIFFKATDPAQYDSPVVRWEIEVGLDSPSRKFFYESLKPELIKAKDSDVLEIGCGSGWLLKEIQKNGARSTIGIEPSKKNFELSRKNFPELKVVNVSLEDFEPNSHFDLVVSNMVFGHIKPNNRLDINPTNKFFRLLD